MDLWKKMCLKNKENSLQVWQWETEWKISDGFDFHLLSNQKSSAKSDNSKEELEETLKGLLRELNNNLKNIKCRRHHLKV